MSDISLNDVSFNDVSMNDITFNDIGLSDFLNSYMSINQTNEENIVDLAPITLELQKTNNYLSCITLLIIIYTFVPMIKKALNKFVNRGGVNNE